jgi:Tfp pilus assembly protein PilO
VSKLFQDLTKYRLFFLPTVIFLAIILTGTLFLKPKLEQIIRVQAELSSKKTRLTQLTTKLAALEGLDVAELEAKISVVLQALPGEKDLGGSLLVIRGLTQTVEAELRSVQVEPGEISTPSAQSAEKYNLPFLSFKIKITGTLEQLKEFLAKSEEVAPLTRLDKIDISQKEGGLVEADLDLETFFLPLPVELGGAEKPLPSITAQEEKIYQNLSKLQKIQPSESPPSIPSGRTNPFIP